MRSSRDDAREAARQASVHAYNLDQGSLGPDRSADLDLQVAARLAVDITGSTNASLHILDGDRAVRLAGVGAPAETVPRTGVLCDRVLFDVPAGEVFETRDAATDPTFDGITTDIGHYAMAPLFGREGLPLGAVCVWDSGDAVMTSTQRDGLVRLAEFVSRVLDLRRRQVELEHDALHDPLTRLANRRLLLDRLDHSLKRHGRQAGEPLLALLDLRGFKDVNDTFGHAAGDHVLVTVGQRLVDAVRSEDTVCRWGGDEFVVLCERVIDEGLPVLVQRLQEAFAAPFPLSPGPGATTTPVRCSIGTVLAHPDESAGDVLARADAAMYRTRT